MRKPTPPNHTRPTTSFSSGRAAAASIEDSALRREVNDRIYVTGVWLASNDCIGRLNFLCECGMSGCELSAQMTLSEYADVRRQDGAIAPRYIVARGHRVGNGAFVVERHAEFAVVEYQSARGGACPVGDLEGLAANSSGTVEVSDKAAGIGAAR